MALQQKTMTGPDDLKSGLSIDRTASPHPFDPRVLITTHEGDLSLIHTPGIKAVILKRPGFLLPASAGLVEQATHDDLLSLSYAFEDAARPSTALARIFTDEVAHLVTLFNTVASEKITATAENVLVNSHYRECAIDAESNDDWPEHHAEIGYELRLISAFAGRGTEWVAGDMSYKDLLALNKKNLHENALGDGRHRYLDTHDVVVLKGDKYASCRMTEPNWSPDWLVHREPMPQAGVPRLGIVMPYL